MNSSPRAIFLRPSLGIGGAERWAIDAAQALQADGWDVEFVVNSFDPRRTLPEARFGRIKISALGGRPAWLAAGRLRALTALLGQWLLLRRLRRRERGRGPDLLICDLVPHAAPQARKLFPQSRVLIYCHFPDTAPAPGRGWYGRYRAAIARRETRGMLAAHRVIANSEYTAAAIRKTFPELPAERLAIVTPGVEFSSEVERDLRARLAHQRSEPARPEVALHLPRPASPLFVILVLARFDPFKNQELALASIIALRERLSAERFAGVRLIVAGGFDRRLPEARALVERLQGQTQSAGLTGQVEFHFDPSAAELSALWQRSSAFLHPAPAEHFGIVLIEAMARQLPVLAVAHGGPSEIVDDPATGALRPPDPAAFAAVLADWIQRPEIAAATGRAGRMRAQERFSAERFARDFAAQARSSGLSAEAKNA